ncbi:MAG: PVC-type heme-binding CxxCH protein [Candidatus Hydrogenedentes bacterium]|nr:PVC-type heme-binding CxxCH protein [Candidatus Hydrogenedentota bacterium]
MSVWPGFEAQLVACEPMVRQPVAMEFDDRGRLWVVQYMQYPNPEGLKRVKVDRYSRTEYDRVPEPPPHGPRGDDVIAILEDTDGDGRMDASRSFLEGLNLCSGIAFGHGGVFVIQVPYLLFYPDRDHDDVPDSDPEVLVTGFGMEDAHSVANSLTWGPDGWLYGLQGSTVTANINGIEFQQGIWRYHPVSRKFELFCEGGGNMWGLDFDAEGNMIACTNFGPYIALHGVHGGYYWKQFGKHGALHNPYTFGYFEHATHHNPDGGHVVVGGTVYDADAYPEEFRGKFIAANLLSHNVYWNDLTRIGSTFETSNRGELLDSNDTWFAPSDMTLGPDGALYVADWCDRRTAHPDPDASWDRSNGRIYRIAAKGMKPVEQFDLGSASSRQLIRLLDHPNKWFARRAMVNLAERSDAGTHRRLKAQLQNKTDARSALNALSALYVSGGFGEPLAGELLKHPNAVVRKWSVRFLGDADAVSPEITAQLVEMAADEPDVMVRSQLASTAKRMPPEAGIAIAWTLLVRDADNDDLHIPLLLWWAVEHHAMEGLGPILDAVESASAKESAMVRETLLPRLVRRYAAEGNAIGDGACVRLLAAGDAWNAGNALLEGLDDGLQDRQRPAAGDAQGTLFAGYSKPAGESDAAAASVAPVSDELRKVVLNRWAADQDDPLLLRLATRLGDTAAYARAMALAANASTAPDLRLHAIELLGEFGREDCMPVLLELVSKEESDKIRQTSLDAIRRIPDDRAASALLAMYPAIDDAMKGRVRDVLFTRAAWSKAFVDRVDAGAIEIAEVPLDQVRVMSNHEDEELRALIEKHWGVMRSGTPEEKLADMRRLNNELNAGQGNPEKGKAVYKLNCAQCHQIFGEGFTVGPELTQSNRMDREYLLASLVDPNLLIRKEYVQYIVETKDGGLFNGLIAERTPGNVTLVNANNIRTTIAMDDVHNLREAGTSLMPEGLVTPLPGEDLRDLVAFLQSAGPETSK